MRALLAFSFVLLFAVPLFASAVELPVDKDVCRSNRLSIERAKCVSPHRARDIQEMHGVKGKNTTNAQRGSEIVRRCSLSQRCGQSCPDIYQKCDPSTGQISRMHERCWSFGARRCPPEGGRSIWGQDGLYHRACRDALKGADSLKEEIDDISNNVADARISSRTLVRLASRPVMRTK